MSELLAVVRRKEVKKRAFFRIPLYLTDRLAIGVRGYPLIIEQKRPTPTWVYLGGEQQQRVKVKTFWVTAPPEDETQIVSRYDVIPFVSATLSIERRPIDS